MPLIGFCFEIYCCALCSPPPSTHNKAASDRGDDISAGADVNFATDRARPSGGSYHGLSQLSRRVKRLSQPPSSWNCHIFTGVAGPQVLFITVTKRSVVERVMKCSKLDKFCINCRMKGAREGNLFVSLGLTARVTRVQRAQVLQPLCGIIFAWIWEIQNCTMHPMHFQGVSVLFKKFNGRSKPGIPGISGDAASPGICHIPFALITHLVRVNDELSFWDILLSNLNSVDKFELTVNFITGKL